MRIIPARRTAAALATSVALGTVGVSGLAQAQIPPEWQGQTANEVGFFGFDINRVGDKRVVENLIYDGETTCYGQPSATFASGSRRIAIKNNAFEGKRDVTAPVGGEQKGTVTISGRQMKGGAFRGTVLIKQVFGSGRNTMHCTSGKLRYEVDKMRPQRG